MQPSDVVVHEVTAFAVGSYNPVLRIKTANLTAEVEKSGNKPVRQYGNHEKATGESMVLTWEEAVFAGDAADAPAALLALKGQSVTLAFTPFASSTDLSNADGLGGTWLVDRVEYELTNEGHNVRGQVTRQYAA